MERINKISKGKLFDYIKKTKRLNLTFTKYFYGIKVTKKDKEKFKQFTKTIKLKEKRKNNPQISKILGVQRNSISKWFCKTEGVPYIIHYLDYYLKLGKPKKGYQWVSINSTRGGLFTGPWIQVPKKASKGSIADFLKQFEKDKELRSNLGYILGFTVGDASKKEIERKHRTTRRIQIRLSKKFPTNKKLGDFNAKCLKQLNLKVNQTKDCPAGKRNPNPFYSWASQSSMLIQWIFEVCLGLQNHEKTTYNSIRANWILEMPKKFKISFLQGLADSDGFVDFSAHQVGVITGPNLKLVSKILNDLKIKHRRWYLVSSKIWSVVISIKDAHKLPIFNPKVRSYRFEETKLLFKAKRIKGHWPKWLNKKIEEEIKKGLSGTKLVRKILKEENIAIRPGGIRDKKKRMEKRKNIIILGIECTAL